MIVIRTVAFMGDAIQIEYMDPDRDVRSSGNTILHATVMANAEDARWKDELAELIEAAETLLRTVLGVHYGTPPASDEPAEEDDDDD